MADRSKFYKSYRPYEMLIDPNEEGSIPSIRDDQTVNLEETSIRDQTARKPVHNIESLDSIHRNAIKEPKNTPLPFNNEFKYEFRDFIFEGSCCYPHDLAYKGYTERQVKITRNDRLKSFEILEEQMKEKEMVCVKYNNTLDPSLQNTTTFQSRLILSEDGSRLLIYNMRPEQSSHSDKDNEHVVEEMSDLDDASEQEYLNFKKKLSSASCRVDDIQNFIVGGSSSRFWMLRKHINSLPRHMFRKLPLYSWNCITLQLGYRDVDLVMRNGADMKRLIRFLIEKMETLDGIRGSAIPLIHRLQTRHSQMTGSQVQETLSTGFMNERTWREAKTVVNYDVYREVSLKYNILRLRQKISYHAAEKGQTVAELFLNSLNSLFRKRVQEGTIIVPKKVQKFENNLYQRIVTAEECYLKNIMMEAIGRNPSLVLELGKNTIRQLKCVATDGNQHAVDTDIDTKATVRLEDESHWKKLKQFNLAMADQKLIDTFKDFKP